jgi:hypothetical protein
LHLAQAVADALGRRNAFAGRDGVLDAGQLLDEAPAGGDHQRIVGHVARAWCARCTRPSARPVTSAAT